MAVEGVFVQCSDIDLGDMSRVPDVCTGIKYVEIFFKMSCAC